MTTPESAAKKQSQPSRKGKRAWRKNVDLSTIERSLVEIQGEKRHLGAPLHGQPAEALFVIDKTGVPHPNASHRKVPGLRIDQILASRSKTPAISSRPRLEQSHLSSRNRNKSLLTGRNLKGEALLVQKLVEKVKKTSKSGVVKKSDVFVKKRKTRSLISGLCSTTSRTHSGVVDADPVLGKRMRNPWDDAPDTPAVVGKNGLHQKEYVESALPQPVKKPKTIAALPTAIASVAIPDAGASYNPSFDDHQALLAKAVDEEQERVNKIEQVKKKLWYPPELDLLDDETFFDDDDDDTEAPAADEPEPAAPPAKQSTSADNRKTRKDRIAAAKRTGRERELAKKRAEKQLFKDINRVGDIRKELGKTNPLSAPPACTTAAPPKAHRLGPHKQKPRPVDVQLTDELPDSLRQLKPEGNTFHDLFSSIQTRKLIEPRRRVGAKKKEKVKLFESYDSKRFV
ncbi:hypothetical protein SeMB42_g06811 [Synchytrium endobioticum]|uniref:Ribosome biogenesis protein NOP53 n=1 Tax=Synchytrium endobioticum TaxID=286115 RepID=A0A507C8H2_9FUNG|nr:hypothetical protein SeMB42_g06811 [Synchytrium endobioticum]TPX49871.1 hypothetical protein SeLEV6574_g01220 [Synchytrium endobioticum]